MIKPKNYRGQVIRYLHAKMDGHYVGIRKGVQGQIIGNTRTDGIDEGPRLMEIPHIAELLEKLPNDTDLDCELHCPGVQATSVKTMLIAKDPCLQLTPFAVPVCEGKSLKEVELRLAMTWIEGLGFKTPELITFDEDRIIGADEVKFWKEEAGRRGFEGWVAKLAHHEGWYKIKPLRTVDCIVVDYTISESMTWFGGLKAIIVAVKKGRSLVTLASVGSGFEGEFRMECDPKSLVGKVCEISYDSLAAKGRLKFPRFERWRDDKPVNECTWDQLEE